MIAKSRAEFHGRYTDRCEDDRVSLKVEIRVGASLCLCGRLASHYKRCCLE
jgi:hypothetical protein